MRKLFYWLEFAIMAWQIKRQTREYNRLRARLWGNEK